MTKRVETWLIAALSVVCILCFAFIVMKPDGIKKIGTVSNEGAMGEMWGARFGSRECVVAMWMVPAPGSEEKRPHMMFSCTKE